ncbi:MAG: hypothetical protein HWE24_15555 [Oceanospirillaceae bacterium]|nr:hypothetical protein [Oceanospirillaceae bacterium]
MRDKNIDIGIITIVPTEVEALFDCLGIDGNAQEAIDSPMSYWSTTVFSEINGRYLSVVVSMLTGDAGNIESAISTSYFLRDWNPQIMLLTGIAAGISGKVKVGDVIIPNRIHDRTIKVYSDGDYKSRGHSSKRTDEIDRMFKVRPISGDSFLQKCIQLSISDRKNLELLSNHVGLSRSEYDGNYSIRDGSILTENILIRDPSYMSSISDSVDEKCRGGEMEAAGFVRACQTERSNFPWVIFRGVSDFGDSRKDDSFQLLAARNAAQALTLFVSETLDMDLLPENPRANNTSKTLEFNLTSHLHKAYEAERWEEVARIGMVISRPLWLAGQYETRLKVGELTEEAAAYTGNLQLRALTLVDDLGWTNFKIGNDKKGRKYIEDGLRIAAECEDYYCLAKGNRHLASIYRQKNSYEDANYYLKKAKSYAEKVSDNSKTSELQGSLLVSEAKLLLCNKKYNEVMELIETAKVTLDLIKDNERLVKIYSLLGDAELGLGRVDAALDAYLCGVTSAKKIGRFDELKLNAVKALNILEIKDPAKSKMVSDDVFEYAKSCGLWAEAKAFKNRYKQIVGEKNEY